MFALNHNLGNSAIVQGRSGPPSDENERQFRFPFYSAGESRLLRACAVHYRTGFVSTLGNQRGDFMASLDRCTTVCVDKRAELDGYKSPKGGYAAPTIRPGRTRKQHSESGASAFGRRRGRMNRETGVSSRDGVSQEHYSGDTTVGRLNAREVCAMGLQADRNPPATATQITVWELHGDLSRTAFGLIEPTALLLACCRERCVASRFPRRPAFDLRQPQATRQPNSAASPAAKLRNGTETRT
jgi:hypothetical protein